jgi:pyruvate formate lyase activating enzyme
MPAERDGLIMGDRFTPESVVAAAVQAGCRSIAYTYTEPTVYFEFAYETAKLAHAQGLVNVFVTNGYMTAEALQMIHPYLDAANVDLKAFSNEFYKTYCGSKLAPVQETLVLMKQLGVLVEVTTLIIPGLNDDSHELSALARFMVDALGPETPWHISRFHPTYRLTNRPATPVATLLAAREIGLKAGLHYVYTGNVPGEASENTFCPDCGAVVIERWGFHINHNHLRQGRCPECRSEIYGIEMG